MLGPSTRPHIIAMVLAGGEGKRLYPLTRDRAKPAVPFAAGYRIIDVVLSNLVNAYVRRIVVLTQYKSHSLDRHLAQTWRLSPLLGSYVAPVPAQMRRGRRWFLGSADAVYQNLNIIGDERPDHVFVFGADHLYRMDPRQMLDYHIDKGADVTVAAIPVARSEASAFGIIEAGSDGRILRFHEKPEDPPPMPGDPQRCLASMGNYVFTSEALVREVVADADRPGSRRDMGGDIIPAVTAKGGAYVYDFARNEVPGQTERERAYWRDIGTLDAYYEASMDLVSLHPVFNFYNMEWPILTWYFPDPPAKFVHDLEGRRGVAINSVVANGAVVSGGVVRRSILSPRVRVNSYSEVTDSVLFDEVSVGRGAVVRNAIVDKLVEIPEGYEIGVDPVTDAKRFTISEGGVVVIGKKDQLA
ncbi:MAG: glucose-1-phosphate adenylyltransferase [bacterium]|nr:glucose-1-phosphate adenylyltransferase [bacterium]